MSSKKIPHKVGEIRWPGWSIATEIFAGCALTEMTAAATAPVIHIFNFRLLIFAVRRPAPSPCSNRTVSGYLATVTARFVKLIPLATEAELNNANHRGWRDNWQISVAAG